MREFTWKDHLRYRFDDVMSRGTAALIAWLGILTLVMVFGMAMVLVGAGMLPKREDGSMPSLMEAAWMCLMRSMDAGTLGGDSGSWSYLIAMLFVTMGGIFIVSTLIGILTSGIEARIEEMRKGRSLVVETEHTLILGWSPQIFAIISELLLANASRPSACIAILADRDKVEMDDEIRTKVGSSGNTRIVCRTGSPSDPSDLEIMNPGAARAVVVLSPEGNSPDAQVIKALLALVHTPDKRPQGQHIVAEIRDARNVSVARMIGKNEVEVILAGDLIARIAVQTVRQSGLSLVYTELLDFGGDEIYFQEEAALVGKTFGEAIMGYEESAIIGIFDAAGKVHLNPPMDRRIERGDNLIAVSEDDDTVKLSNLKDMGVEVDAIRDGKPAPRTAERILILGWNAGGSTILRELELYASDGSETRVVADVESAGAAVEIMASQVKQQKVSFQQGDTTERALLDSLNIPSYDRVMVLACSQDLDVDEADARTLVTLLHLREIAVTTGKNFSVVSQMLDVRNRLLAEATRADDFVVSDRLVSLLMTQIAESKRLARVFEDLFDADGVQLSLRPVEDYLQVGRSINFYTAMESARRKSQVALGYRKVSLSYDAAASYGVVINPEKSGRVTFEPGDKLLILSQN